MHIQSRWKRLALPLVVLWVGPTVLGCTEGADSSPVARLRSGFPDQAAVVLASGDTLVPTAAGFARPTSDVSAWTDLQAELPARGDGAIRFRSPGRAEVRVRQVGVTGDGEAAERAVAYRRAGGTSFWTAVPGGVEERLHLEADVVHAGVPVASWTLEGAVARQQGDAVDVVDDGGVVRLHVTAPAAYAVGGRAIAAHLAARGASIELSVDAAAEEVLVDPMWLSTPSMSTARLGHGAALLGNGKVLVVGGVSNGPRLATAEIYDPATNSWSAAASMSVVRSGHSTTSLANGTVIVMGGFDGFIVHSSTEIYDPATNTWTAGPSLPATRSGHTATTLAGGQVLIAGGSNSATYLGTSELYDPTTNTFSSGGAMLATRGDHTATLLASGQVLVVGGSNGPTLQTSELYDPSTNTWSAGPSMATRRDGHGAVLLGNGNVLVAGGYDWSLNKLSSAELYDPSTNTFSAAASMSTVRGYPSVTALGNGKVLVAGGVSNSGYLATSELYDPATNTWSASGSMAVVRQGHEATLLGNGQVLISGGLAYGILAEADRFSPLNATGVSCSVDGDCASGFCTDGVCCTSACSGGSGDCLACSVAAGGTQDGVCAPIWGINGCVKTCNTVRRGTAGTVNDTMIASGYPTNAFGSYPSLLVGSVSPGQRQALLKFSLPSLPAGAILQSAALTLTAVGSAAPIRAHRVTASWVESTATWTNFAAAYSATVEATLTVSSGLLSADILPLVSAWYAGTANNGILFERDLTGVTTFDSSEFATITARPRLDVCYVKQ